MNAKYFIALAATLALGACTGKEEAGNATADAPELPMVTVDVARRIDVPHVKTYTASVEAENINNIAPASPNRIKTINVEVGDHVRRGQVLVTLDSSTADQLRINMEQLRREYERATQLLEIGSGTRQQVDQIRAQYEAALSQYNNVLENTELRSPINGVVTARNFDPGDLTGGQPVLTVGQLTPTVKVLLNVSENDMSLVRPGLLVNVTFDAYNGETFSGTVKRVHPSVDPATRTFTVEVQIANGAERLRPGMFARVSLDLGTRPNVVVPDRAVVKQTGSGNKYVYVYRDGKVEFRRVQLGERLDGSYELLDGIADGDTVVITGQSRLADGVDVELMAPRN